MNKKNKVLTAAVCGVIVSSIGAGFLLNKPKEEAKADIAKDIESKGVTLEEYVLENN